MDQTLPDQVGLVDLLNGALLFSHRGREGFQSHGFADAAEQYVENLTVHAIEAVLVNTQAFEAFGYRRGIYLHGVAALPVSPALRHIANPSQKAIGEARRAPASRCKLATGILLDLAAQQPSGAFEDPGKV